MHCAIRHERLNLMRSFHNLWEAFRWNDSKSGYVEAELMDVLAEAHLEWKHAKIYFNNVTDPDLIDHAIFFMGAAEKKYIYLLKRAREKGICVEPFSLNE